MTGSKNAPDRDPERLVRDYADLVLRVCYTYLRSTADAEDVCQDTLVKLICRDEPYRDPGHERPDLPSQRIKIEIASIPSYDVVPRLLSVNYPELPQSFANMLIRCESTDEILADKLISFANATHTPRYRDLWDIPWIIGTCGWHVAEVAGMVRRKHRDYGCVPQLPELLESGRARSVDLATSEEFVRQMQRFVPLNAFEATLGRKGYVEALAVRIEEAYAATIREIQS